MRPLLLALILSTGLGCGGDAPPQTPPPADAAVSNGPTGRIIGTVYSPNGSDVDTVAGARLTVPGGPSTISDAFGTFVLDGVPADRPLALSIAGPAASDAVHGTQELTVTVAAGRALAVLPHLLRGCRGVVDGGSGGAVADLRCAGAGGVSVTFPAQAFATRAGAPFSGAVLVEMTAADPAAPGDTAGLPDDGRGAAGPAILGGTEIRLFAAATRDPLALRAGARATLRFEIAEAPAGLEAAPIAVESFDTTARAWVAEPAGSVVVEDGRRFLEVGMTHFTAVRSVVGVSDATGTATCLLVVPTVCDETGACRTVCRENDGCLPDDGVQAHVLDIAYRRMSVVSLRPNALTGQACLRVPERRTFDILFTYTSSDPQRPAHAELRLRPVRSGSCPAGDTSCRPFASCAPSTCTNLCDVTDRGGACAIELQAGHFGCVSGTLFGAGGAPMQGPVDVLVGGNVRGTVDLPAPGVCDRGASVCTGACDPTEPDLEACERERTSCRSSVCLPVPAGFLDPATQLELRDRVGNTIRIDDPPAPLAGAAPTCPATRPAACGDDPQQSSCVDVGRLDATCDNISAPDPHVCLGASFTVQARRNAERCGADDFEVTLDAGDSQGVIGRYEWSVDDALQQTLDSSSPIHSLCLGVGTWRLGLQIVAPSQTRLHIRDHTERTLRLPLAPCAVAGTYFGLTPPTTTRCTYSGDGLSRDCETDGVGGDTVTTYADAPCGYPCFTGNPLSTPFELAFEPQLRPVVSVRPTVGLTHTDYTLDEYGNWLTATFYGENGARSLVTTYSYDDPARPSRVEWRYSSASLPALTTETMSWENGRLATYEAAKAVFLMPIDYRYRYDAANRLSRVEPSDHATGQMLGPTLLTYEGQSVIVSRSVAGFDPIVQARYELVCP